MNRDSGVLHQTPMRTLYALWTIAGGCLAAAVFVPGWEPSLAIATLGDDLQVGLGAVMAAGGATCLVGATRWRVISTAWAVERSGLILSTVAWGSYTVASIGLSGIDAVFEWGAAAGAVVLCAVRFAVVARRDTMMTRIVQGGQ